MTDGIQSFAKIKENFSHLLPCCILFNLLMHHAFSSALTSTKSRFSSSSLDNLLTLPVNVQKGKKFMRQELDLYSVSSLTDIIIKLIQESLKMYWM